MDIQILFLTAELLLDVSKGEILRNVIEQASKKGKQEHSRLGRLWGRLSA